MNDNRRVLNWALIAALIANVVVWISALYVLWPLPSHAASAQPWRGAARICAYTETVDMGCAYMLTRGVYATEGECLDMTKKALDEYAAAFQKERPDVSLRANYLCKPASEFTGA